MDIYRKLLEYEAMLKDGVVSEPEFQKLKKMLYSPKMAEIGIQDETEFEEYIKRETFREAILMLENNTVASYKEAILLLESLKGWGNSNEVVSQCKIDLEELEREAEKERLEKEKDKQLDLAREKIESQSLHACQEAINELKGLGSWKDAEKLLEKAETKLPELLKIEEEKKAEAEKRKKRITKYTVVAVIALFCIVAVIAIINKVIVPGSNYRKALALEEKKQYEEAITAFTDLGDYKDSEDHIVSCQYGIAVELSETGRYEEAYQAFAALGDYKDSKELLSESKYQYASQLSAASQFVDAYKLYDELGDYKDSAEQAASMLAKQKSEGITDEGTIYFGLYDQDENIENKEPIEWMVLDRKGSSVLLLSKYALDYQPYNSELQDVTWETCSLREWLNKTFMENAFSAEERKKIKTTTVPADKNPKFDTPTGNETNDKVFLLSISEQEKYLTWETRKCMGAKDHKVNGWWLRTPGRNASTVAGITDKGVVYNYGFKVNEQYGPVRPAMWVDLDS